MLFYRLLLVRSPQRGDRRTAAVGAVIIGGGRLV